MNKANRNDDSYCVNKIIVDFNIDQLEYSNFPTNDLSFFTTNTKNFELFTQSKESLMVFGTLKMRLLASYSSKYLLK